MSKKKGLSAPVVKNQDVVIEITDFSDTGEGIGRYEGYTLFVKDAAIGDKVLARVTKTGKSFGYAHLCEIIEASPFRTDARCPIAKRCGGCQLQHITYEAQLRYKQDKVASLIKRIGKTEDYEMLPIIGAEKPFYYRNKAQYPVGPPAERGGQPRIGFYAGRSHEIIAADGCCIQDPVSGRVAETVKEYMAHFSVPAYDESTKRGLVRHIFTRRAAATGEVMVCIVINGHKLPHSNELTDMLRAVPGMKSICLNINTADTNVIMGDKIVLLWGEPYITDKIGDVTYRISPESFYQVNPEQTKKLYDMAVSFAGLDKNDVVWDLYCGIGTISLYIARHVKKTVGVEIVPQAIENAKENAALNGIANAEFYTGAAEELAPGLIRSGKPDVIIVDPPRKGCDKSLIETVLKVKPEKMVYISCDPATLARDLALLKDSYRLEKVQCVDMFPQTVHVETVVLMSRVKD